MIQLKRYRSLYLAFDRFPSSKGAATHIAHSAPAFFRSFDSSGLLVTLGDETAPSFESRPEYDALRFNHSVPGFIERTSLYAREVADIVEELQDGLRCVQFRDPWSGAPVLDAPDRKFRTVFEVNGLPSLEIPARYTAASSRLIAMMRAAEDRCLRESDLIMTPSGVIRDYLASERQLDAGKIFVVPNGAIPSEAVARPSGAFKRYFLYFGAMQPWQGVQVLLRAFSLIDDDPELRLVICCSTKPRTAKAFHRIARNLGIADRVIWNYQLKRSELLPWVQHAIATVAPLTQSPRNTLQGCCPLKILESMAAGTAVIASDMPVTRELLHDGDTGRMVPPDRPDALAIAMRHACEYPDEFQEMGRHGRAFIEADLTWENVEARQEAVYRDHVVPCLPCAEASP